MHADSDFSPEEGSPSGGPSSDGPSSDEARFERIQTASHQVRTELARVIVGQDDVIDQLLLSLFAGGHCLLVGVPGLAKTLAIKTLSEAIDAKFQRIQFTPDLLPADLLGTMIYDQKTGEFTPRKGPIFANLILAAWFKYAGWYW